MTSHTADGGPLRRGMLTGIAAYVGWGLFPLYFKLLAPASAGEILAHRIVWSAVFTAVLLGVGVLMFHEPMPQSRLAAFALVWLALAVFTWDGARFRAAARQPRTVGGRATHPRATVRTRTT